MEIIGRKMPRDYKLVVNADNHLGSPYVNPHKIEQMVDYVASTPNCWFTNIGDNCECIAPHDTKRFKFNKCEYQTPKEQADAFVKLLMPIKKKIIAIGEGNHEDKMFNAFPMNEYISEQLGAKIGGYDYILVMFDSNEKLMHKLLFHHGRSCGTSRSVDDIRRKANIEVSVKMFLNGLGYNDVIACYMGHIHRFVIVEPSLENTLRMVVNTKTGQIDEVYNSIEDQNVDCIHADARWYCCTGSMMKTYAPSGSKGRTSYAERAGYAPAEIGFLVQTVENGRVVNIESVKI